MEIVEDRHGNGSTLITSQLPRDKWHDVIGRSRRSRTPSSSRIVHNGLSARVRRAINAQAPSQPHAPNPSPSLNPRTKRPESVTSHVHQTSKRRTGNEPPCPTSPAAPVGSTGTSRARRRVSREGTPRSRAGPLLLTTGTALSPCLTNSQETDNHHRHPTAPPAPAPHCLVANRSEQVVAIRRMGGRESSVMTQQGGTRLI